MQSKIDENRQGLAPAPGAAPARTHPLGVGTLTGGLPCAPVNRFRDSANLTRCGVVPCLIAAAQIALDGNSRAPMLTGKHGAQPMYGVHYVASRESDQPVSKETSAAVALADAVEGARQTIRRLNINVPAAPTTPRPIGFLIFDATGAQLLHREYTDGRGP
jgi:hypothetical protein